MLVRIPTSGQARFHRTETRRRPIRIDCPQKSRRLNGNTVSLQRDLIGLYRTEDDEAIRDNALHRDSRSLHALLSNNAI